MDENKQGHVYIFESKYFIHIFTELIEKRSQLSFNLRTDLDIYCISYVVGHE